MSNYICQYCGKPTNEVESDYLAGYDHLGCTLQNEMDIRGDYSVLVSDVKPKSMTIPSTLILDTPNDQELGAKIRELWYETTNNS